MLWLISDTPSWLEGIFKLEYAPVPDVLNISHIWKLTAQTFGKVLITYVCSLVAKLWILKDASTSRALHSPGVYLSIEEDFFSQVKWAKRNVHKCHEPEVSQTFWSLRFSLRPGGEVRCWRVWLLFALMDGKGWSMRCCKSPRCMVIRLVYNSRSDFAQLCERDMEQSIGHVRWLCNATNGLGVIKYQADHNLPNERR
jgi:hypothetical protein